MQVEEILISIKFDLGGSFECERDLTQAIGALKREDEEVDPDDAIDMVDARTYNISYLATHLPIQTIARRKPKQERELRLGAAAWSLDESLVVYPWLGVFRSTCASELPLRGRRQPASSYRFTATS